MVANPQAQSQCAAANLDRSSGDPPDLQIAWLFTIGIFRLVWRLPDICRAGVDRGGNSA